jgi:hypothetical protein
LVVVIIRISAVGRVDAGNLHDSDVVFTPAGTYSNIQLRTTNGSYSATLNVSLTVNAQQLAPSVSGINPSSPTATVGNQNVGVMGSNFRSGLTVDVFNGSGTWIANLSGLQVLNVVLGGTLLQDIPSQHPGACKHYSEGLTPVPLHTAIIEEGTLLAQILGPGELAVNSWHHQAALKIGDGLRVNCRARDGVIEGLESSLGKPVLAIQCHPEEVATRYPHFQKLFDWLVQEALSRRGVGV